MALLFMDGFDVQDLAQKWAATNMDATSVTNAATGRFGGSAVKANMGTPASYAKRAVTPSATLVCGAAMKYTAALSGTFCLAGLSFWGDAGATQHVYVGPLGSTGKWQARRGNWSGTLLAESASAVAPIGEWFYVEAKVTLHDTTGRVVVKVNGVTVIDFTGDTKNAGTAATLDTVTVGSQANFNVTGVEAHWDDLYVCDTTGTVSNDFLGDVRVRTLLPNGDGTDSQFTPTGSASHWDNVNDAPPVTSTFNAGASGQRETYALSDIPATVASVLGVQANTYAQKSDTGALSAKAAIRSGASLGYGATRTLTATLTHYADPFPTDPATSAAWTISGVNSAQVGAEVI